MNILNIIGGPVIGALIGYITNFIAVKMLFRPLHPVRIGNFILPFTPGIFPKRKEKLAKALGKAVGNNLLTTEDIENMFLTEELKSSIVQEIDRLISADEENTLKNKFAGYFTQDDYLRGKVQLEDFICEKIVSGISKLHLGTIIVRESERVIKEKTQGTMLALMVNDKLIISLVTPIGEKLEAYILDNGADIIRPLVKREIEILENRPLGDLVRKIGIKDGSLPGLVDKIYTGFIKKKAAGFIQQFDIAGVVEKKVNNMDVLEIEILVLSVMKKELNAIVNLGALIGLVIGTLNIFI